MSPWLQGIECNIATCINENIAYIIQKRLDITLYTTFMLHGDYYSKFLWNLRRLE